MIAMLQAPLRAALPAGANSLGGGAVAQLSSESRELAGTLGMEGVPNTVTLKKTLVMKVKEDPKAASRLVQNWLRQSEAIK